MAKKNKKGILTRLVFDKSKPGKQTPKIPPVRRLAKESLRLIWRYRGLFAMLGLTYLVAIWLLVSFPLSDAYQEAKEVLDITLEDGVDNFVGISTLALGGLSGLFTGPQTQSTQLLQGIITMLFVLGLIFATRHLLARQNDDEDPEVTVKDVLYNSPAPFISFTFVIFIAVLAAVPGSLGAMLIPYVISLNEPWWAEAVFALIGLAMVVLSLFWLVRLLFAFFIVTLPGARPWESVRETKDLVSGRRWSIIWRLFLPGLLIGLVWIVLMVPFLLLDLVLDISWLPLVPVAIGIINALVLILSTVYMYKLYRSLL